MGKVPNRDARGETMPRPDGPTETPLPVHGGDPLAVVEPSPVPEVDEAGADILSGPMVAFVPTVNFDGYPDGKTKTPYRADVEAKAPANYVKHLKSKGLVAG